MSLHTGLCECTTVRPDVAGTVSFEQYCVWTVLFGAAVCGRDATLVRPRHVGVTDPRTVLASPIDMGFVNRHHPKKKKKIKKSDRYVMRSHAQQGCNT